MRAPLRWSFGRGFSLKQAGWSWWNSIAQPQEFPASSHDFSARQPARRDRPSLLLLLVHRLLRSAGELAGDRRDLSATIPRSGASRAQVGRQGGCGCPAESWMGLREIYRKAWFSPLKTMGVLFVFPSTNSGNMFGVLFSVGFEPAKAVIFVRDLAGPKRTSPLRDVVSDVGPNSISMANKVPMDIHLMRIPSRVGSLRITVHSGATLQLSSKLSCTPNIQQSALLKPYLRASKSSSLCPEVHTSRIPTSKLPSYLGKKMLVLPRQLHSRPRELFSTSGLWQVGLVPMVKPKSPSPSPFDLANSPPSSLSASAPPQPPALRC